MTTLLDFIKKERDTVESGSTSVSTKAGQLALTKSFSLALIKAEVKEEQASKFAQKLVELVSSDKFLKDLSDEIREPGITETEDAFVERCKVTMKKLIDRQLS